MHVAVLQLLREHGSWIIVFPTLTLLIMAYLVFQFYISAIGAVSDSHGGGGWVVAIVVVFSALLLFVFHSFMMALNPASAADVARNAAATVQILRQDGPQFIRVAQLVR